MRKKRELLEKDIEAAVCKYAKECGCLVYKFTSPQRRSVPDRLLLLPGGLTVFIEFKRPGGKLTPGQERERDRIRGQGHLWFLVDDINEGKTVIDLCLARLC